MGDVNAAVEDEDAPEPTTKSFIYSAIGGNRTLNGQHRGPLRHDFYVATLSGFRRLEGVVVLRCRDLSATTTEAPDEGTERGHRAAQKYTVGTPDSCTAVGSSVPLPRSTPLPSPECRSSYPLGLDRMVLQTTVEVEIDVCHMLAGRAV